MHTHRTPIREADFPRLLERLKYIGKKTTLICVLVRENIGGIMEFYKLAQELNCRGVEFKKNLQYLANDILDVPKIFEKVSHVLDLLYQGSKMDFVSNIGTWKIRVEYRDFFHKSSSLLERYVEVPEKSLDEINSIDVCHQFGNSLDITENKRLSLCCHYKEWDVSDLLFDEKYYENILYQNKKQQYKTQTPQSCRKCPMPVDRYKNFLKYEFVHNL